MELRKPMVALMAAGAFAAGEHAPAVAQNSEHTDAMVAECVEIGLDRAGTESSVNFVGESTRYTELERSLGERATECIRSGMIKVDISGRTLMGNSENELRVNSKSADLNDGQAIVRNKRKYTCIGSLNDNRVRRFGAEFTHRVTALQGSNTGEVKSATFTLKVPKRVNGELNGC